jgi:predicted permease
MSALRRFSTRLTAHFSRVRAERSGDERLREEMQAHLDAQADDNRRAGMTPKEANRQARIKFGSAEAVRETYHAERGLPFVENLLSDVRYALRILRKSPAFTIVAIVTLMLGIGANVVVFGVLNAVLLQPLAVRSPHNLYQLRHKQWASGRLLTTSYPAFEDLRRRNTTFSGMAGLNAYSNARLVLGSQAVTSVTGQEVTGNYFELLGVRPEAGRLFHVADIHGPNSAPYLVLSDQFWRSRFHGDPSIIGRTVELNKNPFTVIGVVSPQFHGTERFVWPDYWIPMADEIEMDGYDYLHSRSAVNVTVLGRLKPGVTPGKATENLNAIAVELAKEYPETDTGGALRLIHPGLFGDDGEVVTGFLWSVTALALLVLAAACANLAGLFAARMADRSRELALRVALGSSRRRLVRQLLTETALLSLFSGVAGLGAAGLLLRMLNKWHSPYGQLAVSIDARVCFVGLICTLGSALLFGMVPARHAWLSNPGQMIRSGPSPVPRLRRFALRDVLLGVQIAICTLLVTASLVAVRGMQHTLQVPLGFRPQGAMLAYIDMSQAVNPVLSQATPAGDTTIDIQKEILEAARRIPGVSAVGTVSRTPITGGMHGVPIFRQGTTEFTLNHSVLAPYVFSMSPGYLHAAGTRLLRGRDVRWQDTPTTPYVAVVNETFARRMWGRQQAIGQRFILAGNLTEVVGVAEDGRYHDLTESPQPVVYLPFSQSLDEDVVFIVRSPRAPNEMASALERTLSGIVPNAPITVQSWTSSLEGELFPARVATVALGVMGLLAAVLAVTGIFGMAAYSVSKRMKELGIRVALGARKTHVLRAAVGRPMTLLCLGAATGLLAGVFASRLLSHIVYQANPGDPLVVAGAVLTMIVLGIAASAIPARRALAIDPSRLMREE